MNNAFNWRGQPSITGLKVKRHVTSIPDSLKFNGPSPNGSIATPEKTKQKPGVGRSASA